jgi:hypothetical protein
MPDFIKELLIKSQVYYTLCKMVQDTIEVGDNTSSLRIKLQVTITNPVMVDMSQNKMLLKEILVDIKTRNNFGDNFLKTYNNLSFYLNVNYVIGILGKTIA